MIEVRPATDAYLVEIAANIRPADAAEIDALGLRESPLAAMRNGVAVSTHSGVFVLGAQPLCVFGVAPRNMVGRQGVPWFLGSVALEQHVRELLLLYPRYIKAMLSLYPHLANHVHADNRRAVRWLRAAGFTLAPAAPFGMRGKLFHKFTMEA